MFNIRGTNANYQNTFSIKIKGESWTDCIRNLKEVFKTDGVWRLGDNDFYPYRGWVRNYRTNKGCSIDYFFNVLEKRKERRNEDC